MAAKLTTKQIGSMITLLKTKTLYEAGLEFELDKHYKDSRSVKAGVYQYYRKVRMEPEKYGIPADEMQSIVTRLQSRVLPATVEAKSLREKLDDEANKPFPELVLSGRVKAMKLLHAKLDRIARSKKQIDDVNLSTIATTAGILFDKGQIISGEATENVAVLAKVKDNMTAEEAIDAVMRMREAHQVDKDRSAKKK